MRTFFATNCNHFLKKARFLISLNEAADLLAKADNPIIISGGGVVMADAVEECKSLAERLGAPVVNSYLHNDPFRRDALSKPVRYLKKCKDYV